MAKSILVIGGGAAGLTAAICAARRGLDVTVLEKMDRVGKKLLATGNGRCNILNNGPLRYHGDASFAGAVLAQADQKRVTSFFEGLGLSLREEEEGRVYPASGLASSVLDVLRFGCQRHGVSVVCGAAVISIQRLQAGFLAQTGEAKYRADSLIVTGGGKAAPKLGSDGSAHPLLTCLGHKLIPPKPAITQLKTETEPIRGLSGIRIQADIWISHGKSTSNKEHGEILFTEYGISGVAAMQLSRDAVGGIAHLCLLPAIHIQNLSLKESLRRRTELFSHLPLEHFFTGLMHTRLGIALLRKAGIGPLNRMCDTLTEDELTALCGLIADFPLAVTSVQGFDNAQVTAGGIDTKDFDPATMASRLVPGLFAAGEVLNVDGDCGGYNLLFAWASGMLAGENA